MKIVPDSVFIGFVIFAIAGLAVFWTALDLWRIRGYLRRPRDERNRDELFGMVMGVIMALSGLGGVVKYLLR